MRTLIRVLVACTGLALVSCASQAPLMLPSAPVIIDSACTWLSPMSASASDTIETRREIDTFDRAYRANCPAVAPSK